MKQHIKQAEQATKFQETLIVSVTFLLVFVSLGWLALRGDDIRAHRMGTTVEQLEQQERSSWADHPNESRCGWSCVERSYEFKDGEVWE